MTISSSSRSVNIPLQELAQAIHATIHGSSDILISGLSHLEGASSGDVSFVLKPSFEKAARQSQAAALIVTEPIPDDPRPQLVVPNPLVAVTTLAQKFFLPLFHHAAFTPVPSPGSMCALVRMSQLARSSPLETACSSDPGSPSIPGFMLATMP